MKKILIFLLLSSNVAMAQTLLDVFAANENTKGYELKKNEYISNLCGDCRVFGSQEFSIPNGYKSMFHNPNDYRFILLIKETKHLDTKNDKILDSWLMYVFYTEKDIFDKELKYLEETQIKKGKFFYSNEPILYAGTKSQFIISTIKWPTIHQSIRYGFRIIIYPSL